MKFAAVLALAAVAAAQTSRAPTPFEQCIQKLCPNTPTDVNCQAACNGNPNPNSAMIAQVNECYANCDKPGNNDVAGCRDKCNQIYNPTGVVVTDHLVPEGVTPAAEPKPTSSRSNGGDKSRDTASEGTTKHSDSGDHKSGSDASDKSEESHSSGAAALKASLSAAALVAASLAFLA
ncbi:hypothetical protein H4R19_004742 [Coemansia spiralis]|nr:hypothetical protein H4R19_004742 [Coemansia spiralis]